MTLTRGPGLAMAHLFYSESVGTMWAWKRKWLGFGSQFIERIDHISIEWGNYISHRFQILIIGHFSSKFCLSLPSFPYYVINEAYFIPKIFATQTRKSTDLTLLLWCK